MRNSRLHVRAWIVYLKIMRRKWNIWEAVGKCSIRTHAIRLDCGMFSVFCHWSFASCILQIITSLSKCQQSLTATKCMDQPPKFFIQQNCLISQILLFYSRKYGGVICLDVTWYSGNNFKQLLRVYFWFISPAWEVIVVLYCI